MHRIRFLLVSGVLAGLVPAIHAFAPGEGVDAQHSTAFTPVFDGLRPA
jgi:hypothetical protein